MSNVGRDPAAVDTSVPKYPRFRWPKQVPPLSPAQKAIADDFMSYWHTVLPERYGVIEKFNHSYPTRFLPQKERFRTLELGVGLGAHLPFEPLERQEYHCIELRDAMAQEIRRRFPSVVTVVGDCQERIPYGDAFFDRAVIVHVLEHLPNLPAAIKEVERVLKPGGLLAVVLPCDPGLAYGVARMISAERLFRARYRMPYGWLIRREHINSPKEILRVIGQHFEIFDTSYFPLRVPVINLNLCIGLTARKPGGRGA
jgi:SAM-dependent methyltransferase